MLLIRTGLGSGDHHAASSNRGRCDNRISALPIVDHNGIPVGVVSESDLLFKERRGQLASETDLLHPRRRHTQRANAEGLVASDVMTSPPITIRSDSRLVEAARLTQERNVRRLIVVDERGRISGVVSRSDLPACFEIDGWDPDNGIGWSVVAKGIAHDITEPRGAPTGRMRFWPVRPLAPGSRERWIGIWVSEITGRWFRTVVHRPTTERNPG